MCAAGRRIQAGDFVTGMGNGLVDAYIRMGKKNYKHGFISLGSIFPGLSCLILFFYL